MRPIGHMDSILNLADGRRIVIRTDSSAEYLAAAVEFAEASTKGTWSTGDRMFDLMMEARMLEHSAAKTIRDTGTVESELGDLDDRFLKMIERARKFEGSTELGALVKRMNQMRKTIRVALDEGQPRRRRPREAEPGELERHIQSFLGSEGDVRGIELEMV